MTQHIPSFRRRALGRAATLATTALTLAAAAALTGLGTGMIAARAERAPAAETATTALDVAAGRLARQPGYQVTALYQGRIEARRRVSVGFEAGGTVAEILVEEGTHVAAGQPLARLDIRTLQAERAAQVAARAALAAQVDLARLTAERQKALMERDFASAQRHDEARLTLARLEAEAQRADAALEAIDVALSKAVIAAPFDAVVGARLMDEGARAAPGQAALTLYESGEPEFRVGLPEAVAAGLAPGAALTLRTVHGAGDLPEGTLGTLEVTRTVPGEGAWVPAEALAEGVRGLWTLWLIEEGPEGRVARRESVELIHAAAGRAFVRGAFAEGALFVAAGPHRVGEGQAVRPVGAEG
jgi:multidrug efflux pump subunit AcrA (membrane-fusion protein)